MTVSSASRVAGPFAGNGVTTSFPFAFKVFEASDLQVTLTDADGNVQELTSGYSVTLNADQDANPGGTITYPTAGSPLAVGESLVALSDLPYVQETDISNVGKFLPQVIENALDYLTILIQQLVEGFARALHYPPGDTAVTELPSASERANRLLGFDADGNPIASSPITGSTVGEEMQTATASQTLFTLGTFEYTPDTFSLEVSVNGLVQVPGTDYTETSSTEVTFAAGLVEGDEVLFRGWVPLTIGMFAGSVKYIPAGASPVTTKVQTHLRILSKHPEENGAAGDGTTDDTAAFQRCIDWMEAAGAELCVLSLGPKPYRLAGKLTITKPLQIIGQGCYDIEAPRALTRPVGGTWLIHDNLVDPMIETSGTACKGLFLDGFSVYQTGHANPGPGWVPTVHNWVINAEGMEGTLRIGRLHFHNVYNGINCDLSHRPSFDNITGQFFNRAVSFDRIYDEGEMRSIRSWTYWSEDDNVLQWTQANGTTLALGRVDGMKIGKVFAFAQAIAVYLGTSPAVGGSSRAISIGALYADFIGRALVCDATGTQVTLDALNLHLGQAWPGAPTASLPGACGLHIASGMNSLVQISNFYSVLANGAAVIVDGTFNQVWISNPRVEQYDFSNSGAGAYAVNDATNVVYLGNPDTPITYLGAVGPVVTGPGTVRSQMGVQYVAGVGVNKPVASAAAAGQFVVLTAEGEAAAGITMIAKTNGSAVLGAAGNKAGFFGSAGAVKQTGVAVTAAGIHAALVAYGLIAP